MKIGDLAAAQALVARRATDVAMRDRLASGEGLHLMIGQGAETREIVLTKSFLDQMRADLLAGFDARIAEADAGLAAMGVEP